jgi:hypothetical protein
VRKNTPHYTISVRLYPYTNILSFNSPFIVPYECFPLLSEKDGNMRSITAAQKMAQIEKRIAHLEKQALFSTISIVKKQLPHKNAVKRVILSEHPNPKNIGRIIDQVSREMGKSETKAVLKIINSQNRTFKDRVEACLAYNQDPEGWVSENMGGFGGRVAFDPVALTFASVTALLVGVTWFSLKSIFTFRQAGLRNKIWGMVVVALFGALNLSPQAPHEVVPIEPPEPSLQERHIPLTQGFVDESRLIDSTPDYWAMTQTPSHREIIQRIQPGKVLSENHRKILNPIWLRLDTSNEVSRVVAGKAFANTEGVQEVLYEVQKGGQAYHLNIMIYGDRVAAKMEGVFIYEGVYNRKETTSTIAKRVERILREGLMNYIEHSKSQHREMNQRYVRNAKGTLKPFSF